MVEKILYSPGWGIIIFRFIASLKIPIIAGHVVGRHIFIEKLVAFTLIKRKSLKIDIARGVCVMNFHERQNERVS